MKSDEFINNLPIWASEYIQVCLNHEKEVVSGSGKVVKQKERHIPTIAYFLNIWLPMNKGESIHKDTYYTWLLSEDSKKSDSIKKVDALFTALATDIVANEGKGIFYAKNKLGMTDKQQLDGNMTFKADFGG
jgi:hypothetical protein